MNLNNMEIAVEDAKRTMDAADEIATKLARLLIGRMRRVDSGYALRALKKELADYNMKTGAWK